MFGKFVIVVVSLTSPLPFTVEPTQRLASSINIVSSPLCKAYVGLPTLSMLASSWASCESHVMACARLPGSTQLKNIQDAFLGCHEGLDCIRHCNRCPTSFASLCSLWLGFGECNSPTAIPKVPFELTESAFS